MYYVQDAHSFWDWIYFVLLIVVSTSIILLPSQIYFYFLNPQSKNKKKSFHMMYNVCIYSQIHKKLIYGFNFSPEKFYYTFDGFLTDK